MSQSFLKKTNFAILKFCSGIMPPGFYFPLIWKTRGEFVFKMKNFFVSKPLLLFCLLRWFLRWHSESTFAQDYRVLTPPSPSLIVPLCSFSSTPARKVRSFWLGLTLSPSISVLLKFREKKNNFSLQIFAKFYFWWIEKNSVKMKNSAKSQN